jgi:RNA polymerase sigma factor (sigma-70 family)
MNDVTRILTAIEAGDPAAAEQLLPLVYDELRRLAAAKLAHEKPGQTLQATALVHEAYLRLVAPPASREREQPETASRERERPEEPHFNSRGHFFAAAAEAMRRILVERARARQREKRSGERQRLDVNDVDPADDSNPELVLAVSDALDHLAAEDEQLAALVKLRFFAGLSVPEAGDALGISRTAAYDHWTYAKARLRMLLDSQD